MSLIEGRCARLPLPSSCFWIAPLSHFRNFPLPPRFSVCLLSRFPALPFSRFRVWKYRCPVFRVVLDSCFPAPPNLPAVAAFPLCRFPVFPASSQNEAINQPMECQMGMDNNSSSFRNYCDTIVLCLEFLAMLETSKTVFEPSWKNLVQNHQWNVSLCCCDFPLW